MYALPRRLDVDEKNLGPPCRWHRQPGGHRDTGKRRLSDRRPHHLCFWRGIVMAGGGDHREIPRRAVSRHQSQQRRTAPQRRGSGATPFPPARVTAITGRREPHLIFS